VESRSALRHASREAAPFRTAMTTVMLAILPAYTRGGGGCGFVRRRSASLVDECYVFFVSLVLVEEDAGVVDSFFAAAAPVSLLPLPDDAGEDPDFP